MVARPHHATLAKAAKLGFEIAGEAGDDVYTVTNKDHNISISGLVLPELLEDAKLARMLAIEYGFKVEQDGYDWVIKKGRRIIGTGKTLDEAWEAAQDKIAPKAQAKPAKARKSEDDEEDGDESEEEGSEDDEEGEDEEPESKSIVKAKYRTLYKPHKSTCGDDFQSQMREFLEVEVELEDGTVVTRIDLSKLRALAEANGVWDDKYGRLNAGQQRMNIGNRLRAKIKRGEDIEWAGKRKPKK